jgi:hypothetical protein
MNANELAETFLKWIDVHPQNAKWSFNELKTAHGVETRNSFLDACSEAFAVFAGRRKPLVYAAVREALRRRGSDSAVQRYAGMVLLNLVSDASGHVDELIDIVAPVFDVSNGEIPAFLVEQVGLEPLLNKIKRRKEAANGSEAFSRLDSLALQARIYHDNENRKRPSEIT